MALNNPGVILKLWTKVVKKHEEGKNPAGLPKKGQEQKLRIKKGLTVLKFEAPAARVNPAPFVDKRDQTAVLLRKYCRYLKTSRDEDKKSLPKYLKTVIRLAVLVQDLDPGSLDLSDDDVPLDALDAVQTDALEKALGQPDTDADVAEAPLPADMVPGTGQPPDAKAPAGDAELAKLFAERWAPLSAALLPALKAKPANLALIQKAASDALKLSRATAYGEALAALDQLENQLQTARNGQPGPGAGVPPAPPKQDPATQFQQRRKALEPQLLAALKEQRGDLTKLRAVFAFAQEQADKGAFATASQGLDALAKLLQQAAAPPGGDAAPDGKPDLKAWKAARADAIQQLRKLQADVVKTKDPDGRPVVLAMESIIKNLTPEPVTGQQVAELRRYLRKNDLITAVEEVPPTIGKLKIFKALRKALKTIQV